MTDSPSSMVRLDAFQSAIWASSDTPVAILNDESTLHERIAYCWGLANHLHVLSDFLCDHDNREIKQVAALFSGQLQPLETLLQKLGDDTKPGNQT